MLTLLYADAASLAEFARRDTINSRLINKARPIWADKEEESIMTIRISHRNSWSLRALLAATALGLGASTAFAADPIKIGVIAEAQAIAGASIPQAAQLAADEINANGGVDGRKIEIIGYDNHSSSADSVRAFQRAVNEEDRKSVV